ncbi:MAG: TVP38/TMEM64 family protein [Gemmatimonadales bacterium]
MSRRRGIVQLVVLVALLAVAFLLLRNVPVREWLSGLRDSAWGPAVFVLLYAALVAVNFSGLALTLAGGVVFGFALGSLVNTVGANLGASAAFWLARLLGRDGVRGLVGERAAMLDRFVAGQGPLWLLRLRLVPIVPFNLLNLASGLSAMRWPGFALATAIGILPGTLIYTYFADAIVAGAADGSRQALGRVLVAGLLLLALSFLPALGRRLGWVGPK